MAAKDRAETAQAGAVAARTGAETAQTNASTASDTSKKNADLTTDLAETAQQNALKATAQAGIALHGSTNVKDNVRIQAVLLPHDSAKKVFGKEIANHYAIIQVIVDNQSEDSSFLLQSVFMDYSNWALSGMVAPTSDSEGNADCRVVRPPDASQVGNCPGEVASVEYRVIRGQLQDAAVWSGRNTVVRLAVFAGSVSTGLAGLKSKAALGYSSSYSGDFIPALQVLWPDPTIAQVNRVSDLGFQTNKVFPKGSADILYAFFPIERFLSPGLKHLFLNDPALFFSPAQLFFDTRFVRPHWYDLLAQSHITSQDVEETKDVIKSLLHASDKAQKDLLGCIDTSKNDKDSSGDEKKEPSKANDARKQSDANDVTTPTKQTKECPPKPDDATILANLMDDCGTADHPADPADPACRYKNIFAGLSLNKIRVVAGGVMSVNTQTIPANITSIDFVSNKDSLTFWSNTDTEQAGSVSGRFLTGGKLTVTKIIVPGATSPKPSDYFDQLPFADRKGEASDSLLPFTMQFKKDKPVPPGSTIYFAVTKSTTGTDKKPASTQSMDYELVTPSTATPPAVPKPASTDPTAHPTESPAPAPPATNTTPPPAPAPKVKTGNKPKGTKSGN